MLFLRIKTITFVVLSQQFLSCRFTSHFTVTTRYWKYPENTKNFKCDHITTFPYPFYFGRFLVSLITAKKHELHFHLSPTNNFVNFNVFHIRWWVRLVSADDFTTRSHHQFLLESSELGVAFSKWFERRPKTRVKRNNSKEKKGRAILTNETSCCFEYKSAKNEMTIRPCSHGCHQVPVVSRFVQFI